MIGDRELGAGEDLMRALAKRLVDAGERLLDDAAYGSGVISSSLRKRTPGPLLPAIQGVAGLRMVRVRSAVSTPWTRSRLVTLTDE